MKVLDFILCEDIRKEEGNKSSLMGVFGHSVTFTVMPESPRPIAWRLGIFIRVVLEENDQQPDRFEVKILSDDDEIAGFEGPLPSKERPKIMAFPLVANPLPIPGNCQLTVKATFWSGADLLLEERLAHPLEVIVNEVPEVTEAS